MLLDTNSSFKITLDSGKDEFKKVFNSRNLAKYQTVYNFGFITDEKDTKVLVYFDGQDITQKFSGRGLVSEKETISFQYNNVSYPQNSLIDRASNNPSVYDLTNRNYLWYEKNYYTYDAFDRATIEKTEFYEIKKDAAGIAVSGKTQANTIDYAQFEYKSGTLVFNTYNSHDKVTSKVTYDFSVDKATGKEGYYFKTVENNQYSAIDIEKLEVTTKDEFEINNDESTVESEFIGLFNKSTRNASEESRFNELKAQILWKIENNDDEFAKAVNADETNGGLINKDVSISGLTAEQSAIFSAIFNAKIAGSEYASFALFSEMLGGAENNMLSTDASITGLTALEAKDFIELHNKMACGQIIELIESEKYESLKQKITENADKTYADLKKLIIAQIRNNAGTFNQVIGAQNGKLAQGLDIPGIDGHNALLKTVSESNIDFELKLRNEEEVKTIFAGREVTENLGFDYKYRILHSITTDYESVDSKNRAVVDEAGNVSSGELEKTTGHEDYNTNFSFSGSSREATSYNFEYAQNTRKYTNGQTEYKSVNLHGYVMQSLVTEFELTGSGNNPLSGYTKECTKSTYTRYYNYDTKGNAHDSISDVYQIEDSTFKLEDFNIGDNLDKAFALINSPLLDHISGTETHTSIFDYKGHALNQNIKEYYISHGTGDEITQVKVAGSETLLNIDPGKKHYVNEKIIKNTYNERGFLSEKDTFTYNYEYLNRSGDSLNNLNSYKKQGLERELILNKEFDLRGNVLLSDTKNYKMREIASDIYADGLDAVGNMAENEFIYKEGKETFTTYDFRDRAVTELSLDYKLNERGKKEFLEGIKVENTYSGNKLVMKKSVDFKIMDSSFGYLTSSARKEKFEKGEGILSRKLNIVNNLKFDQDNASVIVDEIWDLKYNLDTPLVGFANGTINDSDFYKSSGTIQYKADFTSRGDAKNAFVLNYSYNDSGNIVISKGEILNKRYNASSGNLLQTNSSEVKLNENIKLGTAFNFDVTNINNFYLDNLLSPNEFLKATVSSKFKA
ncbi:MAG: hypothetical protein ACD_79C00356G0001, partial [uncultured bacterium]